jgi:hypothetical protein
MWSCYSFNLEHRVLQTFAGIPCRKSCWRRNNTEMKKTKLTSLSAPKVQPKTWHTVLVTFVWLWPNIWQKNLKRKKRFIWAHSFRGFHPCWSLSPVCLGKTSWQQESVAEEFLYLTLNRKQRVRRRLESSIAFTVTPSVTYFLQLSPSKYCHPTKHSKNKSMGNNSHSNHDTHITLFVLSCLAWKR